MTFESNMGKLFVTPKNETSLEPNLPSRVYTSRVQLSALLSSLSQGRQNKQWISFVQMLLHMDIFLVLLYLCRKDKWYVHAIRCMQV